MTNKRVITIASTGMITALLMSSTAHAQQLSGNVLTNGGFEDDVMPTYGNHTTVNQNNQPTGWTFGSGDQPNIVKVDGPGGQATWYTTGPDSDATNAGAGVDRQYLDIANGRNNFYQTFKPECTGEVKFGGAFSNRGGTATGSISIRNGDGLNGSVVGQTNTVTVAGGPPVGRPWLPADFTTNVVAGQTYSFVVDMNDEANFDEGYVKFVKGCGAYPPEGGGNTGGLTGNPGMPAGPLIEMELEMADPSIFDVPSNPDLPGCCSPWTEDKLKSSLKYQGTGNITDAYTLHYSPDASINAQMEGYINYLHALDPGVTSITVKFKLYNKDQNPNAPGLGTQLGSEHSLTWTAGGSSAPSNGNGNFFSLPSQAMNINNWYRVQSSVSLNNGKEAFGKECATSDFMMNIEVKGSNMKSSNGGGATLKTIENGKMMSKKLQTVSKKPSVGRFAPRKSSGIERKN
ncbi:hypothetical protein [Henriciella litoralis]|uniref:hypothetical protein n=1 Tax=Henriciella litoralis TaxID=568102 RepID=UPI000A018FDB|nr:hypothetical protein [Henriciella litoralis]